MNNLLYIHGFNSSPNSYKAQVTKAYFNQHFPDINFYAPQIRWNPCEAISQLEGIINKKPNEQWAVIGSSLGGFYSNFLSERYHIKAVLINPAVRPFYLVNEILGEHVNPYTQQRYVIENHHIEMLKRLEQKKISKNNYLVMVQTGDEVLDYQQAVEKYQDSQLIVQTGGDHSFIDYDTMLPVIARFLALIA